METMKECENCKEESKYRLCDYCWESLESFEKQLSRKRGLFFFIMQDADKFFIIKKCKGKDKRFIRKYFRNYFNWCGYQSNCKNKLGKYWRLKI